MSRMAVIPRCDSNRRASRITRRRSVVPGVLAGALVLLLFSAVVAFAQTVDDALWATNGQVYAMARSGNTLFVGGSFTQVGVPAGPVVRTDPATGEAFGVSPRVGGTVTTMEPDGSGGWYLGGSFISVNGVARANLAHVASDGTVLPWDPGTNTTVSAIAVCGSVVYVGGNFTTLGGQPRSFLGSVDAATGAVTSWNPGPNSSVSILVADATTLYAGGLFTSVAAQARQYAAAFDLATVTLKPWSPDLSGGFVNAILPVPGRVIVAGEFGVVSGESHPGVVAVDPVTALPLAWNPNADGSVRNLACSGSTLWIAGAFSSVGGTPRLGVAAVDVNTGALRAWDANLGPVGPSFGFGRLAVIGDRLYMSGTFTSVGGVARPGLAAVDTATAALSGWAPTLGGSAVTAIYGDGASILMSGTFRGVVNGQPRANLAAIDLATGQATAWNPGTDGTVSACAVLGSNVYVGGAFGTVGGLSRPRLAAVDVATGVPATWNPVANGTVKALAASGSRIYVGGAFTSVGGASRNTLGALDPVTGLATSWNPSPSGGSTVNAISLLGSTVYVGGDFTAIGATGRYAVAAIDSAAGIATSWYAQPVSAPVNALVATSGIVHVGTAVGYWPVNTASGATITGYSALLVNNAVKAIAVSGSVVALGGTFTNVTGLGAVTGLALVDTSSWTPYDWNPAPSVGPATLLIAAGRLYAGGTFTSLGRLTHVGLAAIGLPPATLTPRGTTVVEGHTGSTPAIVRLDLNHETGDVVSVNYAAADSTARASYGDYVPASGTVVFQPGETSKTVVVGVLGDLTHEGAVPEYVAFRLSSVSGATLVSPSVAIAITDDDPIPTLSVADVATAEGNSGTSALTFTLQLTNPTYLPVTVNFATSDSTAIAPGDYAATSGVATIPAESPSVSLAITIVGDTSLELDEAFRLVLSGAMNTTLTRSVAVGTIRTDEMGPAITVVTDIAPDQGGWLRISLDRCLLDDALQLTHPIMTYNVWRKLPDSAAQALADERPSRGVTGAVALLDDPAIAGLADWPLIVRDGAVRLRADASTPGPGQAFPPGTWEIVSSFAAMQRASYTVAAPASVDTPSVTTFVVSAHAIVPSVWYVGSPGSGCSGDNIPPGVTVPFSATLGSGGVQLAWGMSAANDFAGFRLYRGTTPNFVPAPTNLQQQTTATAWTDPNPGSGVVYYKLIAVDHAGNEGAPAAAQVTVVTGVEGTMPSAFSLGVATPNPSSGATRLELALPRAGHVRIVLIDASGRVVRELAAGSRPAGWSSIEWDGRGMNGAMVAPGLYFCRMEVPEHVMTRRVIRLR